MCHMCEWSVVNKQTWTGVLFRKSPRVRWSSGRKQFRPVVAGRRLMCSREFYCVLVLQKWTERYFTLSLVCLPSRLTRRVLHLCHPVSYRTPQNNNIKCTKKGPLPPRHEHPLVAPVARLVCRCTFRTTASKITYLHLLQGPVYLFTPRLFGMHLLCMVHEQDVRHWSICQPVVEKHDDCQSTSQGLKSYQSRVEKRDDHWFAEVDRPVVIAICKDYM